MPADCAAPPPARTQPAALAESAQGEPGVEAGERLDFGIRDDAAAKCLDSACVVPGAIAQQADVVADAIPCGVDSEGPLEWAPRLVVVTTREIGQPELEERRILVGLQVQRPLERCDGLIRPPDREQDHTRVVDRIDVVGRELERLSKGSESVVEPSIVVRDDSVGDEDIGLGCLGSGESRRDGENEEQRDEPEPVP